MCIIYHMNYEFNNWDGFYKAVEFVKKRHAKNFPEVVIQVPSFYAGLGWKDLDYVVEHLERYKPDDLKEMSIYGIISFDVTQDENLNRHSGETAK